MTDKPVVHRMLGGSHESRFGPECRCGAEWDWWNDRCTSESTDSTSINSSKEGNS